MNLPTILNIRLLSLIYSSKQTRKCIIQWGNITVCTRSCAFPLSDYGDPEISKTNPKRFKRQIWLYVKGNYTLFRNKLFHVNWNSVFSSEHLNVITDIITAHITTAAKEAVPNKIVYIRPSEPEWMNSNLKRQIRQCKRLFRHAKRVNTVQKETQ